MPSVVRADGSGGDVQPLQDDDPVSWEAHPSIKAYEPSQHAAVHGADAKRDPATVAAPDARGWHGEYPGDDEVSAEYGWPAGHASWNAKHAILSFPT